MAPCSPNLRIIIGDAKLDRFSGDETPVVGDDDRVSVPGTPTYGTHKEPHVPAWPKKHPQFVCHFIPISSSWLNLMERWFRELTEKSIRRGSFVSVPDLKRAIDQFMHAKLGKFQKSN